MQCFFFMLYLKSEKIIVMNIYLTSDLNSDILLDGEENNTLYYTLTFIRK